MNKISQIILMVYIMAIFSCASSKILDGNTIEDRFLVGMKNLEKEKYLVAQTDFKYVTMRGGGSDLGDDALYYLGESYFRNEEYILAIAEYEKLTRNMGYSPFVEDARFKICEAYRIESPKYFHDQEYTEKALQRYQEFLDDFPDTPLKNNVITSIDILREKLGKKIYETGILYMKLEEYESAKISFQMVIDIYYDTDILSLAYQGMVKALAKNREMDDAISYLEEHKAGLVDRSLYQDAKKTIEMVQKKISKEEN